MVCVWLGLVGGVCGGVVASTTWRLSGCCIYRGVIARTGGKRKGVNAPSKINVPPPPPPILGKIAYRTTRPPSLCRERVSNGHVVFMVGWEGHGHCYSDIML